MGRSIELVVEGRGHSRLDRYLLTHLTGESRAAIQRLIEAGHVQLMGRPPKPSTRLHAGDRIVVEFPDPLPSRLLPEAIPLTIVHRDDHFLVIDKPAGMVVHPGAGRRSGTLVNALLSLEGGLSTIGGEQRPGIVHRLDRETSGLLVVARDDLAHRKLSAQFAAREVNKVYLALVWGLPAPARGRIEAPLGRHPISRTRMSIRSSGGRTAITEFEAMEQLGAFTLMKVRILTGRTHQIRVHLSHLGHPVVGDRSYGGHRFGGIRRAEVREALEEFDRLALHAHLLEFHHPVSGEPLRFESPLPADFVRLLDRLRSMR